MRYRIEAITLPVNDVDAAKAFYEKAGWHLDVDTEPAPGIRVVQFTPPGSECSITFGTGMPQSEPGSYRSTYLVVATSSRHTVSLPSVASRSATSSTSGPGARRRVSDPKRGDYGSYATFADPDGNTWLLQEVPSRASTE